MKTITAPQSLSGARYAIRSPRSRVGTPFTTAHFRKVSVRQLRATVDGKEPASAEIDLEAEVESFMKRQAEIESGAAFARTRNVERVIGAEVLPDDAAKDYCREIFDILKALKGARDMSVNEVKLIISIEDPRARERRAVGIEDERGVSRDEMAAALVDVAEGRIPKDRIALKCLYEELTSWPYLKDLPASSQPSSSESGSGDYASLTTGGRDTIVKPYIMGKEVRKGEKPQSLSDMLPDWVGYLTLYGISVIPVLLVVSVVLILFYNSLR